MGKRPDGLGKTLALAFFEILPNPTPRAPRRLVMAGRQPALSGIAAAAAADAQVANADAQAARLAAAPAARSK